MFDHCSASLTVWSSIASTFASVPSRRLSPRCRTPPFPSTKNAKMCFLSFRAANTASSRPQMVVFQRDVSTGVLSSATTVRLTSMAETVDGTIAGFFLSSNGTTDTLFVSIAANNDDGGLLVLNVYCGPPTPAPTPAPGEVLCQTHTELRTFCILSLTGGYRNVFRCTPSSCRTPPILGTNKARERGSLPSGLSNKN